MKRGSSSIRQVAILAAVLMSLSGAVANAAEWAAVGSRYQAMGGSGVASVNDAFASYWNPAALGNAQSYDADLNFDFVAALEGNVVETVDDLNDIDDDLGDFLDALERGTGTVADAGELADLERVRDTVLKLADEGNGVAGAASTGLSLRWESYAVFSRADAQFAVSPVSDTVNVNIPGIGQDYGDVTVNSLEDNESGARVRGLGVVESGVGYGHRFEVPFGDVVAEALRLDVIGLDDLGTISAGANLKYLHGITFNNYGKFHDENDDEKLGKLKFGDSDYRKESGNFGLDLGLLYEPADWLAIGFMARNVNSPKFKAARDAAPNSKKNFQLDAQARGGIAIYPFKNRSLVIASDLDLTENESDLLDGFKSRLWSFGAEYTLPIPVVKLALRGGGYTNTASGAGGAFTFTGGLGLRVWLLSLDLAGGASPKGIDVGGGDELPSRLNFSAALALKGNF
jgi:hypothetical protein